MQTCKKVAYEHEEIGVDRESLMARFYLFVRYIAPRKKIK